MFKMPIFQGITVLSYQSNYIIANLLYIHASGIILPIKIGEEMKDKEVLRTLMLMINQSMCAVSVSVCSLRIPSEGHTIFSNMLLFSVRENFEPLNLELLMYKL